ncbi:MAG: ABC transporter permease subunit [Desulfobacteraceae bacterium]|nr:ABC transporter permease subunit [Desulfobacteraceae bacterium]
MRLRYLLYTVIICSIVALFIPVVIWSFTYQWFYPDLLPEQWGYRAWEYIFGPAGTQITSGLAQSMIVAAITAILSVCLGTPAGRILGLYDFRLKNILSLVIILPVIVPPLCVAMGLHLWFIRLGLTESIVGVVLIHLTFCLPYAVFVMWGVFANYNPEYEDQARSLGATPFQVFVRISTPMVFNGMVVAGLFAFLLSWSQYLSTLIIGGGQITTLPILLFALINSGDRPVAAAVSLVFITPALLALVFSSRYLGKQHLTGIQ